MSSIEYIEKYIYETNLDEGKAGLYVEAYVSPDEKYFEILYDKLLNYLPVIYIPCVYGKVKLIIKDHEF